MSDDENVTPTLHRFSDDHGGSGDLELGPGDRRRLQAHAASDQSNAAFVLRKTESGRYLFITPYLESSIGEEELEPRSLIGLSTGGLAQLSLETYEQFVDDVRNDKPGVYKAEYIEGPPRISE